MDVCAALMTPSCHGELLPMYDWLLYSHITKEYTALETGLFGEKNKCLCSVVYLYVCACMCVCVCDVCMYLSVNGIDIQSSIWRRSLQYDQVV